MQRAASMCSMFFHLDTTDRAAGMQRWDADRFEAIICIKTDELLKHVSIDDIFVDQGNVSIRVPVPRRAFDRIVLPAARSEEGSGVVLYDWCWAECPIGGRDLLQQRRPVAHCGEE